MSLHEELAMIINHWKVCLGYYKLEDLLIKPSEHEWSLGQVYTHLIQDTNFYLENIAFCLASNNANAEKTMNSKGKALFEQNGFPDIKIINNAIDPHEVQQPKSLILLHQSFTAIVEDTNLYYNKMEESLNTSKSKHSGLGYFNAYEWFRFAEMHFRHHLRQKQRIDDYLCSINASEMD